MEELKPKICRNPNAPKPGSETKVDPIRSEKDIRLIKRLLAEKPRDLAIFVVGINTNFRASDLVRLTVGHFRGKRVGDTYAIREQKTSKPRLITISPTVLAVVQPLIDSMPADTLDDAPLFRSRKTGTALTPRHLHKLLKGWCREINLPGAYGSHSLRKTWGYHQKMKGTPTHVLMKIFNHSSERVTLLYLGINPKDEADAYMIAI